MRYFNSVKEALFEVERDLIEMGIDNHPKSMQNKRVEDDPNYHTKELVGYAFRIHKPNIMEAKMATHEFHQVKLGVVESYCEAEVRDRCAFAPRNPGTAYKYRPEVWEPFLVNGKFDYTYSERTVEYIRFVREALINDLGSRQAVLSIFKPDDILSTGGRRRIPCSMYYQYINRPQAFHVIYTMRSCDIYTHFGFDVTMAIMLGYRLKETVPGIENNKPLTFTMFIGSLHAYKKDYEPRGVF